MTDAKPKPAIAAVPFLIGMLLWTGATGLLLDDVWRTGHITTQHLLMPLLTASTVAAAVFAHHRLASFKLIGAVGFAMLAVLGSGLTVYGTLGRVADGRDAKLGEAMRVNRALETKLIELKDARAGAKAECVKIGPRCTTWQSRVDVLLRETNAMAVVSVDPRADAVVRLATLLGFNSEHVREIIDALDAPSLPLYLELGSIIFFASAFPHRRNREAGPKVVPQVAANCVPTPKTWSQEEALQDFLTMRHVGAQFLLADRWGVPRSTVSRWLKGWQVANLIERTRLGKEKSVLALPPPKPRTRALLGLTQSSVDGR